MSRAIQRWIFLIVISSLALYYISHLRSLDGSFPGFLAPPKLHHVNWASVPQKYPVTNLKQLPKESPKKLPRIQATFPKESDEDKTKRLNRRRAVEDIFRRSWSAYKDNAWGHDEFSPLTKAFKDHFGGWGATLVDTLDSLLIMGMEEDFLKAVEFIKEIDFSVSHMETINVFETTIRYLGGLLSAHELAKGLDNGVLLKKATELGEMLYHAFDTSNRMPLTRWTWRRNLNHTEEDPQSYVLAAELGSMSLEFTRLSQLTGDSRWFDAVQRIADVMEREQSETKIPGLWPIVFDAKQESFRDDNTFTMGGRADSMYEYVPKEYVILGGLSEQHRRMYMGFIQKAKEHLFFKPMNPKNQDILLSGTSEVQFETQIKLKPEGQHLACFVGGMVAIASKVFEIDDLDTAKRLVEGCIWAYTTTATGIMPEVFTAIPPPDGSKKNKWDKSRWLGAITEQFPANSDEVKNAAARAEKIAENLRIPPGMAKVNDPRYILRPEAIESVFIWYRITGDKAYQDVAWEMFQAISTATQTDMSYASIPDVTVRDGSRSDASESFWMAETLKYFYLVFSEPEVISLDDYVFNTEAHPLRIPKPEINPGKE